MKQDGVRACVFGYPGEATRDTCVAMTAVRVMNPVRNRALLAARIAIGEPSAPPIALDFRTAP